MCQSVRDKASLAELAVVGSQPARVALKLDTKETKRSEKGVREPFFKQVKVGRGCVCRKWAGNSEEIKVFSVSRSTLWPSFPACVRYTSV